MPQALDDSTKQRLFEKEPEKQPQPAGHRILRSALTLSKSAVPFALATLLLWGAVHLSLVAVPATENWMNESRLPNLGSEQQNQQKSNPIQADSNGKASGTTAHEAQPVTSKAVLISPITGAAPTIQQKNVWPAGWALWGPVYLTAVFLLLVANVVLTTRPGVVTHDSQQFTDAMEKVWYPVVLAKQNTPRAAKRFVNRVRYLAMRQRGFEERTSTWERILFPDRLRDPARSRDWEPIPEPLLVALAALEQMQPQWVYDDKAFDYITGSDGAAELSANFPAGLPNAIKLMEGAREKHKQTFASPIYQTEHADWTSLSIYRNTFRIIWPQSTPSEAARDGHD